MPKQFYRKKVTGQPDAFYEVGTNRHIGPSEFGAGQNFTEVKAPITAIPKATDLTTNPYLSYLEEKVNKPARTALEKQLTAKAAQSSYESLLSSARETAGIPSLTGLKTANSQKIAEQNKLLTDLQDKYLGQELSLKDLEGQGRGITTSIVRGQQAKEQERITRLETLDKLPILRQLTALTDEGKILESNLATAGSYAEQLAKAKQADITKASEAETARFNLEQDLNKPITSSILDLFKTESTKNATLDELLSPAEAKTLGIPYGTTKGQAADMKIIPTTKRTGSSKDIPTGGDIKFTSAEKKDLAALGAQGYTPDFQNFLLQNLTPSDRQKFMAAWKKEQEDKGASVDPIDFYEYWRDEQEKKKKTGSNGINFEDL